MIRRLNFNAVLTGLFVWVAFAQSVPEGKDEIAKVLQGQVDAWNEGNIEGYMEGYWKSDSTMFVSGGTVTTGYGEVLSRYKKGYDAREKMGRLEFQDLTVRLLSADAAIATGVWNLYRGKDQPWGRFTLVLEKKPEGWRITHDHTSVAEEKR
ncbi:MAG: DUF4440 domain-containing protein [Bacteroidota bacterium]